MAGVGDARKRFRGAWPTIRSCTLPDAPRVPGGQGRGMVTSRHLVPETSSAECPRCESALVVPAIAGGPSESVLQLRSSTAPVGRTDASGEWLCRSCGLRWSYERTTAVVDSAAGELDPEPSGSPGELIDLVDVPDVHGATGVTSRRVAATLRQAGSAGPHGIGRREGDPDRGAVSPGARGQCLARGVPRPRLCPLVPARLRGVPRSRDGGHRPPVR